MPTLAELGVTDFDVDLWYAVLAPAGTPKDDRRPLQCGVQRDPGAAWCEGVLDKQGLIAQGGPPERLAELIAKDRARWAKVVKDAQITAE